MAPTQEQRERVLRLYDGLRLTDVCDAMDAVGLQDVGLMDKDVRPLWQEVEDFKHRIAGFAHTVRFVPTGRRAPAFATVEEHKRWKSRWYGESARGPLTQEIRPGDVIVADGDGVIVVPWDKAAAVAKVAQEIQEGDKAGRRQLYEKLGRPPDFTVEPRKP